MYDQNIKPRFLVLSGPLELDLLVLKRQIYPLIPHMANSENGYFGTALLKKDRLDLNMFDVGDLAEIVDVVVGATQIK